MCNHFVYVTLEKTTRIKWNVPTITLKVNYSVYGRNKGTQQLN